MEIRNIFIIILRFLWIPVSAIVLLNLIITLLRSLGSLFHRLAPDHYYDWRIYMLTDDLAIALIVGFTILYLFLEIKHTSLPQVITPRSLTNLRFGPMAVTGLFLLIVPVTDAILIERSKAEIRAYIFDGGESVAAPEVIPHIDHRSWCGNGMSARQAELYSTTASSGLAHDDPYVRSRSLLMANRMDDILGGSSLTLKQQFRLACDDESPVVVRTVQGLLLKHNSTCDTVGREY